MDSNIKIYKQKKKELALIVDKWWTSEDLTTNFDELLAELKTLASTCPESFVDGFEMEVQEIEAYLRGECLIE